MVNDDSSLVLGEIERAARRVSLLPGAPTLPNSYLLYRIIPRSETAQTRTSIQEETKRLERKETEKYFIIIYLVFASNGNELSLVSWNKILSILLRIFFQMLVAKQAVNVTSPIRSSCATEISPSFHDALFWCID